MNYTNSPLVDKVGLSPNHSGQRKYPISRITPHCFVGQVTVDNAIAAFRRNGASCNYTVAKDGRIALICEEKNRSWCTSSSAAKNKADANDDKAVTIEVASDTVEPYAFAAAAYDSLIKLSSDIARRNGKSKLVWIPDKSKALAHKLAPDEMLVTVHRWYAAKACPGNWLYNRLDDYVAKVNALLQSADKPATGDASKPADNPAAHPATGTPIMGASVATREQMQAYANRIGMPAAVSALIPLYLSQGKAEGVRGDIAFAQSCLETGNFRFSGSAVTMDQNNFYGMGVTSNGTKGNSFSTASEGILAQVQHLKAYASTEALREPCVDPRFRYVARGCATVVEHLGQKENPSGKGWATGKDYGAKILKILDAVLATKPACKPNTTEKPVEQMYRVRKSWSDAKSQVGAFRQLSGAKACVDANPGYTAYDADGNAVYSGKTSGGNAPSAPAEYKVQVSITNLNIRRAPDKNSASLGFTGAGIFTIVETRQGPGSSSGWGRLKSGRGWISLDFAKKL